MLEREMDKPDERRAAGLPASLDALPPPLPRFFQPDLIVFVSSACVMVLELVAGRVIAPYVGVSLYTWTTVIGVVLAGMTLGNYLGGWLADRHASPRLLGLLFVLAGLISLGVLAVDGLGPRLAAEWPIVVQILVLTGGLFLPPAVLLGTISPLVAKLAVRDLARTGRTVGRIYAAGAAGSIAGTFATGYWLIAWLGTHTIVWSVALVLLALGTLLLLVHRRRPAPVVAVVGLLAVGVMAAVTAGAAERGWLEGPCTLETNYFCIRVHDAERDGHPVRVLTLDRLVHSHSSLDDPTRLVYGYERMYAQMAAYLAGRQAGPLSTLSIGGGGYTFPRYLEAVYPNSRIDVIEIDPEVTRVAHEVLGLARDSRVSTANEDARLVLAREPVVAYNLILGDAFNDFSVPYHLTTIEFDRRVRAWLAPDGYYVLNLIDGPRGAFLRATVRTLGQVFDHVYVAPAVENWRQVSRSTFVLVAGDQALDLAALRAAGGSDSGGLLTGQLMSDAEVETLLGEGRVVTLTDDYAPVEQMLQAVFREQVER